MGRDIRLDQELRGDDDGVLGCRSGPGRGEFSRLQIAPRPAGNNDNRAPDAGLWNVPVLD